MIAPYYFSKFLPVLFIGTGAGAVDTANFEGCEESRCIAVARFILFTAD